MFVKEIKLFEKNKINLDWNLYVHNTVLDNYASANVIVSHLSN